jgi:hypothetical protein
MSIRYVATVLDSLAELSQTDTLVMIALADYASDDTGQCWPAVSSIMRRARLSRRAVFYALKRLQERGYIASVPTTGRASAYTLLFDHAGKLSTDTGGTRAPRAPTRAPRARGGAPRARGGAPRARVYRTVIDPSLNLRASDRRPEEKSKSRAGRPQHIAKLLERHRKRGPANDSEQTQTAPAEGSA